MQDWHEIGSLDDIPRRGARCVMSPDGRIAVFRTVDDRVFATEDRCPHKGGPLSQGIVHGAAVTCPLHGMVFSLESGSASRRQRSAPGRMAAAGHGRRAETPVAMGRARTLPMAVYLHRMSQPRLGGHARKVRAASTGDDGGEEAASVHGGVRGRSREAAGGEREGPAPGR